MLPLFLEARRISCFLIFKLKKCLNKSHEVFTRNTAHTCCGNNSGISSDLMSNVSKVYSASIVREYDAVLFSYRSWIFLSGSWVQTQVESPPKMSEIFYDLPCKKIYSNSKKIILKGEDPVLTFEKTKRHQSSRKFIISGQRSSFIFYV